LRAGQFLARNGAIADQRLPPLEIDLRPLQIGQ
jgi:hypothetical protein